MKRLKLPRLGARTVKTALYVAICLLLNLLLRDEISLYAAVAAIVCMQSSFENTVKTAVDRLVGTGIGGAMGLAALPVMQSEFPAYLIVSPLLVIAAIYLCNAIRKSGAATICAIVLISVLLITPDNKTPYAEAFFRIAETVMGVLVAMAVNRFIFPARLRSPRTYADTKEFDRVRALIADRLTGFETVFLYAREMPPRARKNARHVDVTLPLPEEYCGKPHVHAAYVSTDMRVSLFKCRVTDGFITIPAWAMPCTVVFCEHNRAVSG